MNGRKARATRHAASRRPVTSTPGGPRSWWRSWRAALVVLAVGAVITASTVVPDLLETGPTATTGASGLAGLEPGAGLPAGSPVPEFTERDVTTGASITSESILARKTLLFFSEGIMCQACLEQIRGLERVRSGLDKRGIQLVSITPDAPDDLRRAVSWYRITTPMVADDDRDMSRSFNTLGQGMHGDAPGHAFVLVEQGKVLWYRDYWLAPTRSMYVAPDALLAEIARLD